MPSVPITKRPRGRPRSEPVDAEASKRVQALERGLSLMRCLAKDGDASLNALALRADIPASSAHRLLVTLQNLGFADYDADEQLWSIGLEAFRVGSSYLERTNLVEASHPVLKKLMEDTGETANLGIADRGDVVFLIQIETHHPIRAFFSPGARGHMHASGIGKALLAASSQAQIEQIIEQKGLPRFTAKTLTSNAELLPALAQISQRGWSLDDEERYLGMRCIAAPVFNAFGEAIAGISVSGPSQRFSDADIAVIGPKVSLAARALTDKMGGRMPLSHSKPI